MSLSLSVKLLFFILPVFFLTGCATYNTATGRNEVIFISTSQEVAMGKSMHQQIASSNKFITEGEEYKRLQSLAGRIARVSDRQDYQYHFFIIDKDEVNAFTTPGGYVYFYSGLLRKLPSDAAVAAVLAHEIGHCAAKHTVKKFQGAFEYNAVRNVAMRVLAWKFPQAQGIQSVAGMGADALMNLAMTAYSRHDEHEADRLGIKYLYLAGFDLNGMIETFRVLKASDKSGKVPAILRSHPLPDERIKASEKEIEAVKQRF